VDRDAHDFAFLSKCERILAKGGTVLIFPESRLPRPEEARPLEFKPSYVYLALESGAPLIPVYNNGNLFSKSRNHIIISKPIDVAGLYDASLSEKENIRNINAYVRSKIIELGKELECQKEKAVR
jgi:1-acyl-sn-glycerol-3-phosphate acyltransferase